MGAGVTVLFSIGEALKKKDERAGGGSDSSEAALIGGRWPEALSTARFISPPNSASLPSHDLPQL